MGHRIQERFRRDLLRIFRAGVAAVDPKALVDDYLRSNSTDIRPGPPSRLLVVGVGKGGAAMAAGTESALGADRVRGLVIVPDGTRQRLGAIEIVEAGHPIPDQRGIETTRRLRRLLEEATCGPVLFLLSGGASSLLVSPTPPVTLEDKGAVTQRLLEAGVDIHRLNTVRKHLSRVKGGGLLRSTKQRPIHTLILSDVIGDDPSVIGSGPTSPDPTTFVDAAAVLDGSIPDSIPDSVRSLVKQGSQGRVPETVKPGDPETDQVYNVVIGSNQTALISAAAEAERLGFGTIVREAPLAGETRDAAFRWYSEIRQELASRPPGRYCLLAGGETVVEVTGAGRGGRNQEFALCLVALVANSTIALLSAGTDGIDGPTDAAGAFVDGASHRRAQKAGLDIEAFLQANDSYAFFERLGDLLVCGPTGTNVMDLKIAVASTLPDDSRPQQD